MRPSNALRKPRTGLPEPQRRPARSLCPARSTRLGAAALLCLALAQGAVAKKPENVTNGEIALLPPYCIDTEGFHYGHEYSKNRSPRASHWEGLMGKGFWTLHHYCWGLVELRRLQREGRTAPQYGARIRQIVSEYYFVIKNTQPGFVLLPEIWVRIGEAWVLAENWADAQEAYATARSIKPDYWPAYTQWADVLIKRGLKRDAEVLVREGLRQAPTAEALLAQARLLGIAVPPPAAASQPAPPASEPPASASDAATPAASAASATAAPANAAAPATAAAPSASAASTATTR